MRKRLAATQRGALCEGIARGATDTVLACPICREPLSVDDGVATCPACSRTLRREEGIWRLLRPQREAYFAQWLEEYDCVRKHERRDYRGDPSEYQALPFALPTNPAAGEWAIRCASYRLLMAKVVGPPPLRILDLGAGNCWLSHRLAEAGHEPSAVDLRVCEFDGLGAARHYEPALGELFPRYQAEFGALPFADSAFDLAVFNASFHYSTDYPATLAETLRVLKPGGCVAIMDTPVYHDGASGRQMMVESREHFERTYGFGSDSVPSTGYITCDGMDALGRRLGLHWQHLTPWYGWRWAVRPWMARLMRRREPAQFGIWQAARE